ncbi:ankyrin repeat domain-containing protein [Paenibacillus sp. SGZ-1009]|uniref:ankyrin repeat domain-containing protein n=1 Tax=Paenibacillus campi TaxID=3106031 RepID=UPI002AFDF897|nr:ankyrin repeat domain-containing protein [Paenibacillus sp. SGZ-1009]
MYNIKGIGKYKQLPELAMLIYEGQLQQLRDAWAAGEHTDVNRPFERIGLTPLELALIMCQSGMVEALLEQGAELNDRQHPSMLTAVEYASEQDIRRLYAAGAKMELRNHLNSNVYDRAYYGKKQHIPLIHELGFDICEHAGAVLRTAVMDYDLKMIEYLLEQGVNINYNEPNQVFPHRSTPLTVAVRYGHDKIARYLIEHGADVTIGETDGERAYTIALTRKNAELAAYIQSLEPPEFHDLSNKLHALRNYKLPAALIEALSGDEPLVVMSSEHAYHVGRIEFFKLIDTIEMKIGRTRLLRLSAQVDPYGDLYIVWHPASRRIGAYDVEHQEYHSLASWNDFIANPLVALEQVW